MLEMYAGSGTHSVVVCAVLCNNLAGGNVLRVTVDNDPDLRPTIVGDIRAWTSEHTEVLLSRYPRRVFIVHGSENPGTGRLVGRPVSGLG